VSKAYPAKAGLGVGGKQRSGVRNDAGAIRRVAGKLSAAYIMRVFRTDAGVKN
jgi:hypothetical protein